ncbi:hypothetical protein PoB_000358500 [Plakobranchus ocellatus]|uniref:Uncharacterized protein n=1 Tax=Plakobranchus ocellatus TaxID=259542 RepID=A0AAV3Y340_9GAST|nr:hypothetical protein PoB_000358500 [Plakobranchus ocellatus]
MRLILCCSATSVDRQWLFCQANNEAHSPFVELQVLVDSSFSVRLKMRLIFPHSAASVDSKTNQYNPWQPTNQNEAPGQSAASDHSRTCCLDRFTLLGSIGRSICCCIPLTGLSFGQTVDMCPGMDGSAGKDGLDSKSRETRGYLVKPLKDKGRRKRCDSRCVVCWRGSGGLC